MYNNYGRPIRRAAQLAAIRISEYAHAANEITPSDSDESESSDHSVPSIDKGLERARSGGYDSTIYIVKYLLEECENSKNPEDRIEIASKMFDILNKNPKILIYEPKFRNAVIDKLNEAHELIKRRKDTFNKTEYAKAIDMMKLSMRVNISNSKMRNNIYAHLGAINTILSDYAIWMNSDTLKNNINSLSNTLKLTETHPDYINAHQ
jgi:hypothetical protein